MKRAAFRILFVLILACLTVSLTGCSVLSALKPYTADDVSDPEIEEDKDLAEAPDPASAAADNAADPVADEYLPCPQPDEQLTLGFDHTLTMNHEGTSITHILHSGMLGLVVQAANDQGDVPVASVASVTIPYEMYGVMEDCSMEMKGTMVASASGYCIDGTVYLTIIEDWQSASGTMTCPDGQMPFMVPAPGPQVHEGADGAGEVFYLVEGSQGYTTNRPFQEGEGYHSWTLYTTQIDVVPLTP